MLALLAAALMVPAAAEGKGGFVVTGHGFGHGVGLSQWGAYGFAKQGRAYREIATHYFKGTKVGTTRGSRAVRVLLGTRDGSVAFTRGKRACGTDLKPSRTYVASRRGGNVRLQTAGGRKLSGCGAKLVAKGAGPISIDGEGRFRGDLVAQVDGGVLYVVNQLGLDDYIQGVLPNEMPASWPLDALRAQALAARSYALATEAGGGIFDQYDDTRSQVYGGLGSETPETNRAVRKSRLQVLRYQGDVIPAYFSSSSGGRTENVEFGFPGATPQPYLKSVRDPFNDASPDHDWRERISRGRMESLLSGLFSGRLKEIRVLKTGVTPRIVAARVVGSRGSSKISGPDLRARLGLRSTWAKFKQR